MFSLRSVLGLGMLAMVMGRALQADPPVIKYYSTSDPKLSHDEVKDVLAAFHTWNAALKTLDPAKVASLYCNDAVLVPTLSNEVRTTREGLISYFTEFLAKKPSGRINEHNVREEEVDGNGFPSVVSNAGIYTFTFGDGSSATARFTFIYKKVNGKWLIHEHHSSKLPSQLVPSPAVPLVLKSSVDPTLSASEAAGVLRAFNQWNAALATLDPKKVALLYKPDSVLVPTVSDDVRTTQHEREDYFVEFLANHPQGVLNSHNLRLEATDAIGEPLIVSNSGIYTFTFSKTGASTTARYTFVYERVDGEWLILEHHSSKLPQLVQ